MRQLRISRELALPIETVTESIAILAKRNAGKTYTASVLVEEMLKAKLQVVVLDPMGAWWGLRSSADGRGPGFPIARLGGDHGDVPLEPTGGTVVADLVVDERLPAILDLSPFSKTERRRFVADFLERLYHRNREAMHIVLEEADLFAPEGKLKRAGDEQMLGAVYDLVRRGRGRGIGCTLITQRSASLSKEVLTQAEILIALRTTGPQDVAAIKEWIRYHGSDEERELVLASLHELPTGEAYAWWPVEGILKRIRIRARETFDSSATPKPGESRQQPKTVADVDLDALQQRMAATIERAKADDPRELRRQLAELDRRTRKAEAATALLEKAPAASVAEHVVETVEVPVLANGTVQLLETILHRGELLGRELSEYAGGIGDAFAEVRTELARVTSGRPRQNPTGTAGASERRKVVPAGSARSRHPAGRSPAKARLTPSPPPAPAVAGGDFRPSGPKQRILDALASLEAIGLPDASKVQLALFAQASPKSSSYTNNLGALRTAGLIDYPAGGLVTLTDEGRSLADSRTAPSTVEELHAFVFALVGGSKSRLLQALIDVYPDLLEKADLAETAGVSATSSSFTNNLGSLRSLGLIEYPGPGVVAALPVLFLEEAFV